MMKKLHRILIVAACVLLVASMASPAFATMQILYRGTQDGYNCVGAGTIDGNVASAAFSATLSGEVVPTIDPDMCSSSVTMVTFETSGTEIAKTHKGTGGITSGVRYVAGSTIAAISCAYVFNDIYHGSYVYNASN